MKSSFYIKILISLLLISTCKVSQVLADDTVTLESRPGVSQQYLFLAADHARATLVLFAGGKGKLKFKHAWLAKKGFNFLVRTREMFRKLGFNVAIFNAPSDRRGKHGMWNGFRKSRDHVTDIADVVRDLRSKHDVPVWLVGTSRGTESVAWAASQLNSVSGIVLTASITKTTNKGTALTDLPLEKINIPVLILSHENDECHVSDPSLSNKIATKLKNAPTVVIDSFSGGRAADSGPCQARSAHGFYGIEQEVVQRITRFVSFLK